MGCERLGLFISSPFQIARRNTQMRKHFKVLALALALIAGLAMGMASADEPVPANIGEEALSDTLYSYTDSGWYLSTSTYDCAPNYTGSPNYTGWGADQIQLTLTSPQDVVVTISDCCCPGDYYELYIDGDLVGATPDLFGAGASLWGCVTGAGQWGNPAFLSSGSMTLGLPAGTYLFETRDAGFDGHTPAEIAAESMCPAGYSVSGALSPLSGDALATYVNLVVASSGPYRNHGQCVRTAARIVSPLEEAGYISEEVASSIMNPIARSDCGKRAEGGD
jgi:hypothetical protein